MVQVKEEWEVSVAIEGEENSPAATHYNGLDCLF
jgi:hypothetical protein